MKKLIFTNIFILSCLAANAQFGIHVSLLKPQGFYKVGMRIGGNAEYLFAANESVAIGPSIDFDVWTGIPDAPSGFIISNLSTQGVLKYFVSNDIEAGGFYPQINLGLNTYRESYQGISGSASNLIVGLGIGYKVTSGFDINARFNMTNISSYGLSRNNNSLLLQLGAYF